MPMALFAVQAIILDLDQTAPRTVVWSGSTAIATKTSFNKRKLLQLYFMDDLVVNCV